MENDEKKLPRPVSLRKMTPLRLKNIALYYLERFDSSADNLRQVLTRRVRDYAYKTQDFDITVTQEWIENIISEFERLGYLNDKRYAEYKIGSYLAGGKPERYIRIKMQQKGIDAAITDNVMAVSDYDAEKVALNWARKKKIGPFRADEETRNLHRQKDLAAMVRAGFDYETAKLVIGGEFFDESI